MKLRTIPKTCISIKNYWNSITGHQGQSVHNLNASDHITLTLGSSSWWPYVALNHLLPFPSKLLFCCYTNDCFILNSPRFAVVWKKHKVLRALNRFHARSKAFQHHLNKYYYRTNKNLLIIKAWFISISIRLKQKAKQKIEVKHAT